MERISALDFRRSGVSTVRRRKQVEDTIPSQRGTFPVYFQLDRLNRIVTIMELTISVKRCEISVRISKPKDVSFGLITGISKALFPDEPLSERHTIEGTRSYVSDTR